MSYAIIRNAKYKISQVNNVSRHNERKNKNYGNKDIDKNKSDLNYHFKVAKEKSYEKEFHRLREENNLKGNLRLKGDKQSNVMCEFMITSDNDFFNNIGEAETKRFFKTAYDFACEKCDEKNIISATVHMDETTPHMHLTYIPVVKGLKKGEEVLKINASEFWKGFNSYGKLQDEFHAHVNKMGFNLARGEVKKDRQHLSVEEYKIETKLQELELKLSSRKKELKKIDDELEPKKNKLENIDSEIDIHKTVLDNLKQGNDCFDQEIKYENSNFTIDGLNIKMNYSEFKKFKTQIDSARKLKKENEELKKENSIVHKRCTEIINSQEQITWKFTNWIDDTYKHMKLDSKNDFKFRGTECLVNNTDSYSDLDSALYNAVSSSKVFDMDICIKCTQEKEDALKEPYREFKSYELDWD